MDKLTITVKELAQMLGISVPKAYEMTEIEGFPVMRIGKKKIIPVEQLKTWMAEYALSGKNLL